MPIAILVRVSDNDSMSALPPPTPQPDDPIILVRDGWTLQVRPDRASRMIGKFVIRGRHTRGVILEARDLSDTEVDAFDPEAFFQGWKVSTNVKARAVKEASK